MKPEEIDSMLQQFQAELKKLQPTLHPSGDIPFSKIGLLNTARRKAKMYETRIAYLNIIKKTQDLPEEAVVKLLEAAGLADVCPPPEFVRPKETPTGQIMFSETPPVRNNDNEEIYESVRKIYGK
jgi:hypothetical protein